MNPTSEGFRDWLVEHDPTDSVGRRSRSYACPLSAWLEELTGAHCYMSIDQYSLVGKGEVLEYTTDRWMGEFIVAMDNSGDPIDPVTAKEALRVLDEVMA